MDLKLEDARERSRQFKKVEMFCKIAAGIPNRCGSRFCISVCCVAAASLITDTNKIKEENNKIGIGQREG